MRNKGYLATTILEKLIKALPDSEQRRGAKRELKRRYKEELEEEQLTPREEELKFINYILEHKRVSADECNEFMEWNPREGSVKRTQYKKKNPYKIDYDKTSNCYVSLDIEVSPVGSITISQDWECEL